ncbi:MAG: TetR/AcrR family transcriptional regulator [Candidatus Acidiferrales bacterium]
MASRTAFIPSKAVPNSGRRERRRVETRERLFRAALDLFARRGFLETTVEAITEAADVGKGTFFNYFPTKEHVLATFGAQRIAAIERGLERARRGPVLPVLEELAIDLAGQSRESPALLRAIYAAHASCAPVRAELQKRLKIGRRLLARILDLAQERGEIRRDIPAEELARLIQLILLGVGVGWALDPDESLQGRAGDVWRLLSPSLINDRKQKHTGARVKRKSAAPGSKKI